MKLANDRRPALNRKVDPERFAALAAAGLPLRRIAAELAVARRTARAWRDKLGVSVAAAPSACKVDPAEFAALAALGHPLERIAALLGVSATTSRAWREKLGLRGVVTASPPKKPALGPAERDAVSASDNHTRTARELGISPSTVRVWRRRLGIPAVSESEKTARRNRANRERRAAARELAREYGLPTDLTPLELSVLLSLLGGPATCGEVAAAVGPCASSGEQQLYAMARRGLVAALRRGNRRLYCLTAAALDMIAAAGEVPQ